MENEYICSETFKYNSTDINTQKQVIQMSKSKCAQENWESSDELCPGAIWEQGAEGGVGVIAKGQGE